jgi:ABC-type branched-subunit amino acid transport system ATPase component
VARCGIGRLFQDVRVFASLSVIENVLVGFAHQKGERLAHALFDRRRVAKQEESNREEALRLLSWVRLEQIADSSAEELSFGQQKLLAIARLLAGNPQVLLLDEPMAGVDPVMRPQVIKTVKELSQNLGKTVVLVEHDIAAVEEIADQVLFVDEGQVIAAGSPERVLGDATVRMIYLGLSPLSGNPAA